VDAWLLLACSAATEDERLRLIMEALALADRQGFSDLAWRAGSGSLTHESSLVQEQRPGYPQAIGFDAMQAQRRAPWLD